MPGTALARAHKTRELHELVQGRGFPSVGKMGRTEPRWRTLCNFHEWLFNSRTAMVSEEMYVLCGPKKETYLDRTVCVPQLCAKWVCSWMPNWSIKQGSTHGVRHVERMTEVFFFFFSCCRFPFFSRRAPWTLAAGCWACVWVFFF